MAEVAAEMYLRGMEFLPISLAPEATAFKIEDGKTFAAFQLYPWHWGMQQPEKLSRLE